MAQTLADKIPDALPNVLKKHLKFANPAKNFPMDAELESLGLDSMSAMFFSFNKIYFIFFLAI